jgi:hypothetical protein
MKNSNDTIGNQTRDLPTYSTSNSYATACPIYFMYYTYMFSTTATLRVSPIVTALVY